MFAYRHLIMIPIVAALLSGCAATRPERAPAPPAPKPALWKLSDRDTTIYLFGTLHVLPKGLRWRTPAIEKAISQADELVLETRLGTDLARTGKVMVEMGTSPGLPPLAERVPPDKRAALDSTVKASKLPVKALDRMETWAAALMLTGAAFRNMGLNANAGVEKSLEGTTATKPRTVSGIETVEQQFGFFDGLSEEAQRAFLVGAIDNPGGARAQLQAMTAAWAAGDVEGIAATFDGETALSPELRAVLMTRRNAVWADWIEAKLDTPGTILVAVGAGHLAGRDSLQKALAAKGLRVKRVQ